jgi:hypothetical protein
MFTADMGLHIAILTHCVEMGFALAEFAFEKQAREKYDTELEIEVAVLTKPLLKACFPTNLLL